MLSQPQGCRFLAVTKNTWGGKVKVRGLEELILFSKHGLYFRELRRDRGGEMSECFYLQELHKTPARISRRPWGQLVLQWHEGQPLQRSKVCISQSTWLQLPSVIYFSRARRCRLCISYSRGKNESGANKCLIFVEESVSDTPPALIPDLIFWDCDSKPDDGRGSTGLFNLGFIFSTPFTVLGVPDVTVLTPDWL